MKASIVSLAIAACLAFSASASRRFIQQARNSATSLFKPTETLTFLDTLMASLRVNDHLLRGDRDGLNRLIHPIATVVDGPVRDVHLAYIQTTASYPLDIISEAIKSVEAREGSLSPRTKMKTKATGDLVSDAPGIVQVNARDMTTYDVGCEVEWMARVLDGFMMVVLRIPVHTADVVVYGPRGSKEGQNALNRM